MTARSQTMWFFTSDSCGLSQSQCPWYRQWMKRSCNPLANLKDFRPDRVVTGRFRPLWKNFANSKALFFGSHLIQWWCRLLCRGVSERSTSFWLLLAFPALLLCFHSLVCFIHCNNQWTHLSSDSCIHGPAVPAVMLPAHDSCHHDGWPSSTLSCRYGFSSLRLAANRGTLFVPCRLSFSWLVVWSVNQ